MPVVGPALRRVAHEIPLTVPPVSPGIIRMRAARSPRTARSGSCSEVLYELEREWPSESLARRRAALGTT